jgi:competence protein ComEC
MKSIVTRFRAYQLGSSGSSFSYFAGGHFTLLEGRLTELSRSPLMEEMGICRIEFIDTLHITSWDADHCSANELEEILSLLPTRIECPGYHPHTDNGIKCLRMIQSYQAKHQRSNRVVTLRQISPDYIKSLNPADALAFDDILYHPRWLDENCTNNNSTVKIFRGGCFNLLSLGDVESHNISSYLRSSRLLCRETDILILAHHGADNGFTNKQFLARIKPRLAICSSDYDNFYEHPREEIRKLLHEQEIPLMTSKTGDVVVRSVGDHTGQFEAINLMSNSKSVSSRRVFRSKKSELLSHNSDTIRQLYAPKPYYRGL